jgi:hypothetical protein
VLVYLSPQLKRRAILPPIRPKPILTIFILRPFSSLKEEKYLHRRKRDVRFAMLAAKNIVTHQFPQLNHDKRKQPKSIIRDLRGPSPDENRRAGRCIRFIESILPGTTLPLLNVTYEAFFNRDGGFYQTSSGSN